MEIAIRALRASVLKRDSAKGLFEFGTGFPGRLDMLLRQGQLRSFHQGCASSRRPASGAKRIGRSQRYASPSQTK